MIALPNLNAARLDEFISLLGNIYEHSEWVPEKSYEHRPFATLDALIGTMRRTVDQASEEQKLVLIRAHPDLAGKLARAGALTEASTREQAGLGLDRLTDAEYETFTDRNERYRKNFGFPFIICARKTTKQGVLDAFEKRLSNSRETEISEAIVQIHEIARLRLEDAVSA